MAIQWPRRYAFTAEGPGSVPGRGTKIPQSLKRKKKKRESQVVRMWKSAASYNSITGMISHQGKCTVISDKSGYWTHYWTRQYIESFFACDSHVIFLAAPCSWYFLLQRTRFTLIVIERRLLVLCNSVVLTLIPFYRWGNWDTRRG